jgi:lysophospholipase L1-like esterase
MKFCATFQNVYLATIEMIGRIEFRLFQQPSLLDSIKCRPALLMTLCLSIGASLASVHAQTAQLFALHDGDRVVFYGDNISDVQFYDAKAEPRLYTTFVETYAVTRFPAEHFEFINSAWSGERVRGGLGGTVDLRLRRDIFAHRPNVLTIMLGMNDGNGRAYDPELFKDYVTGYKHIVDSVRRELPSTRITLIRPSAYDDVTQTPDFPGGYNNVLIRYGAFLKKLGEREHHTVADFNAPLVAVLQKAQQENPIQAQSILPDRTHPGPAGQLILAAALLQAWHAPSIVSSVRLDVLKKRFADIENSSITDLKFTNAISWTQLDRGLPFPLDQDDPTVGLVLKCSDFVESLDRQKLQIVGLSESNYRLEIDGGTIDTFTRAQLAEGINLALYDTPMKRQALHVYDLTRERNDVYFGRWRQLQLTQGVAYKQSAGKDFLNTPAKYGTIFQEDRETIVQQQIALRALDKLNQELATLQHKAAQPKPHYYRLVPE